PGAKDPCLPACRLRHSKRGPGAHAGPNERVRRWLMDFLRGVLEFLANNLFNEVAILIGLIALTGLLLQKKPVEDVLAGTLRAMIGIYILLIGTDVFIGGLVAFQTIVSSAFGMEPPRSEEHTSELQSRENI